MGMIKVRSGFLFEREYFKVEVVAGRYRPHTCLRRAVGEGSQTLTETMPMYRRVDVLFAHVVVDPDPLSDARFQSQWWAWRGPVDEDGLALLTCDGDVGSRHAQDMIGLELAAVLLRASVMPGWSIGSSSIAPGCYLVDCSQQGGGHNGDQSPHVWSFVVKMRNSNNRNRSNRRVVAVA